MYDCISSHIQQDGIKSLPKLLETLPYNDLLSNVLRALNLTDTDTTITTQPQNQIEIINYTAYDTGVSVSWAKYHITTGAPSTSSPSYKLVISPIANIRDKQAVIIDTPNITQHHFINLQPDTAYQIRVGIRGDDSTQSIINITTTGSDPSLPHTFNTRLDLQDTLALRSDKIILEWTNSNNIGQNTYLVERAVGDNEPNTPQFQQNTGLTPKYNTNITDTIRPDWMGQSVLCRITERLPGPAKIYSDTATITLPDTLQPPTNAAVVDITRVHNTNTYQIHLEWDHTPLFRNYLIEKQIVHVNGDISWERLDKIQTNTFAYNTDTINQEMTFRIITQSGHVQSTPTEVQYGLASGGQ